MASLEGFNPAEVEPTAPIELIPAGEYPVILIETDLVQKDSGAVQFEYCVQITEGEFQNRRVYSQQNYTKKDGMPNQIGRGFLSQICRCVGVMSPRDTSELHHKRLIAKIGVQQDKGYEPRNNVKGFKPYEQPQQPQASPQQPNAAASWAATVR